MNAIEVLAARIDDLRVAAEKQAGRYNEATNDHTETMMLLAMGEAHGHVVAAIAALGRA